MIQLFSIQKSISGLSILRDTVGTDAYQLDIAYGPGQQRWKTDIFAGDYEQITDNGVTQQLYYLHGAVYVKQTGQSDKIYYTHTDHLGSIVSMTDGSGTEVFKAYYDAWGKQTVTNSTFKFHRGYTGHEHLPEFSLINMNARMYDPVVGRFLSPDPYVQFLNVNFVLLMFKTGFFVYLYLYFGTQRTENHRSLFDPAGNFYFPSNFFFMLSIGFRFKFNRSMIVFNLFCFPFSVFAPKK